MFWEIENILSESIWLFGVEYFCGVFFGDVVREGERKVFGNELMDVGVFDIFGFFEFDNMENLGIVSCGWYRDL